MFHVIVFIGVLAGIVLTAYSIEYCVHRLEQRPKRKPPSWCSQCGWLQDTTDEGYVLCSVCSPAAHQVAFPHLYRHDVLCGLADPKPAKVYAEDIKNVRQTAYAGRFESWLATHYVFDSRDYSYVRKMSQGHVGQA